MITDRGTPVVRLLSIDAAPRLEELTRRGVLSKPQTDRPNATGAKRVRARGSVSELVGDQRR